MIEGVTSFGPSQATPLYGCANVSFEIPAWYGPGPLSGERLKSPLSAVFADPTLRPRASLITTVTPGRPSSPCSTTPVLPPPGLKSRQTTPAIPFDGACGCTAW